MYTDDELYYKLGYNILNYRLKVPAYKFKYEKRFGTFDIKSISKEKIIEWSKNNLVPILSDEQEIIKRKDWDLNGLIGATEKQLLHPHFDIMKKYFFNNYKPQHKTAFIMLCSNKKPYRTNKIISQYYKLVKDKADMFIISNPGIIPIEYDNYYPFRWYEWDEKLETKEIKKLYINVTQKRIEEWFNYFTYYDKIICLIRWGETKTAFLNANIPQQKIDILNNDFILKLKEQKNMRAGFFKYFLLNFIEVKNVLEENL